MKNLKEMKTNITRVILLSAVVFTLFCQCKEDDPITGTISGTITLETGSALSGIQLYLINNDFEADTLNFENNRAAFLDSTVSDALGAYWFENIPEGNYAVVPLPGELQYRFSYAPTSDENPVSIGKEKQDYTLNFSAPDLGMFEVGSFIIQFIVINAPEKKLSIASHRVYYFNNNIPQYCCSQMKSFELPGESNTINFIFDYGSQMGNYTLSNNFRFEFLSGSQVLWYSFLYLPLTKFSVVNTYEVDWASQTVTRK